MKVLNLFLSPSVKIMEVRINLLQNQSKALWGEMTVAQMLAHCSVVYDIIFDKKIQKQFFLVSCYLQLFVKPKVLNNKEFEKHMPIRHQKLKINDVRDFEIEKTKLIKHLHKIQQLGDIYFSNRNHINLGKLSIEEWNLFFYKHLDHHLRQFGV